MQTMTFANLTATETRRVARIRTAWQQDYYVDGVMGGGWAFGSFDRTRTGVETVTYTDGTTERREVTSEDDDEGRLCVGQYVSRTKVLVHADVAADGIPF
jgi:hypothetical protein